MKQFIQLSNEDIDTALSHDLREEVRRCNKHIAAMQARIKALETENSVMYAAILEASELGSSAALRCKVELQRIARNEAK